jgi:hypothetical protein
MFHSFRHRLIGRDVQAILNNMRDSLDNIHTIVPGAQVMRYALDHDGILTDYWKGLLGLKINIEPNWSPEFVGSFMRIELGTILEWYCRDAESDMTLDQGTNWFLKYESFLGINRKVFRAVDGEYKKIEAAVDDEIAANGETVWPYIVFILKARKFVVEGHDYEIDKIDHETYRITGVDPSTVGYYTIDFRFRGVVENAMIDLIAGEEKE